MDRDGVLKEGQEHPFRTQTRQPECTMGRLGFKYVAGAQLTACKSTTKRMVSHSSCRVTQFFMAPR